MNLSNFLHMHNEADKAIMSDLIKKVFASFDNFQIEDCYIQKDGEILKDLEAYINDPSHRKQLEKEWKMIEKNSPVTLPKDYKELFLSFGKSIVADHRENSFPSDFMFWNWDDIEFFEDMSIEEFWEELPKMIPVGHDMGDRFYAYGEGPNGLGVYWCDVGCGYYIDGMKKLADSFTELFTNIRPLE